MNQRVTFEDMYAAALRCAAKRENLAVFGSALKPDQIEKAPAILPAWRKTFEAMSDEPIATTALAAASGQKPDTVRKHLHRLQSVGAALNGPPRAMPQGGFEKTWIKGKEPGQ